MSNGPPGACAPLIIGGINSSASKTVLDDRFQQLIYSVLMNTIGL